MEEIIILTDDDGNELEFEYVDSFDYEGQEYVVLLPVDENDPEIAILKVEDTEDPEVVNYVPYEGVPGRYYKAYVGIWGGPDPGGDSRYIWTSSERAT